jgi:hypothetical protein
MSDEPSAQSMFFDILNKQSERIEQLEANQKFIYETLLYVLGYAEFSFELPNPYHMALFKDIKERSK